MINQSSKLEEMVKIYRQSIPLKICEYIKNDSHNYQWETHKWHDYNSLDKIRSPQTEFLRSKVSEHVYHHISHQLVNCIEDYRKKFGFTYTGFTHPSINLYDSGTQMLSHYDHIRVIFDGTKKGIPILTMLAILNDDFVGGDFIMWDDYKLELSAGDLVIFPSVFTYPHRVNKILEGVRYSLVSWVY